MHGAGNPAGYPFQGGTGIDQGKALSLLRNLGGRNTLVDPHFTQRVRQFPWGIIAIIACSYIFLALQPDLRLSVPILLGATAVCMGSLAFLLYEEGKVKPYSFLGELGAGISETIVQQIDSLIYQNYLFH